MLAVAAVADAAATPEAAATVVAPATVAEAAPIEAAAEMAMDCTIAVLRKGDLERQSVRMFAQ